MFSLHQATAETVSQILHKEILTCWGIPTDILSDQGPKVCLICVRGHLQEMDHSTEKTSPYHPQTNLTERINWNIKAMIASYVEEKHKNWSVILH